MIYENANTKGSLVNFAERYDNFIGGEYVPPAKGKYFENISPVTGEVFCEVARYTQEDVDLSVEAASPAQVGRAHATVSERGNTLKHIANRIEQNLAMIAVAETWDNGKAVRETLAADGPLAIDHFRYSAGAIRAQEGGISQIDSDTVAYHFHEPVEIGRAHV